jgi:hypothetical protein
MSSLLQIRERQGFKRPETPEEWAEYEKVKLARRATNVANAAEVLRHNEVEFEQTVDRSFNKGAILFMIGDIRYYPEDGKWFAPGIDGTKFGVRNLVRYLKGGLK